MPIGQPAITEPKVLHLQAVQQAIINIRERFAPLEAAVLALSAASDPATVAATLRSLQAQITALSLRPAQPGQGTGGSGVETVRAGEALATGVPVFLTAGPSVLSIDPDDPLRSSGFYGVTITVADVGLNVQVQRSGIVTIPGAAFAVGRQVYAAAGDVTQAPAGNVLPIGIAVSATQISITPGTLGLAVLADPTGDDFLPVVLSLVTEAIELAAQFNLTSTPGPVDGDVLVYESGQFRPRGEIVETEVDVSYSLQASDARKTKVLEGVSGASIDCVLPAAMPQGFSCFVMQGGPGEVLFLPESGAVLLNWQGHSATAGQYGVCRLFVLENLGAAVWVLTGDTAA